MGHIDVEVTHPERVLIPDDGITKRDLVDYYCAVADAMLPHLKDRPLNVQRFPRGMRNAYAQTAVAAYSVRPRRGAPVATPLEWDELATRRMRADRFTIREVPRRLSRQRDPWADMYRHSRSLHGPIKRLAKLRARTA
jgi:DNA primase